MIKLDDLESEGTEKSESESKEQGGETKESTSSGVYTAFNCKDDLIDKKNIIFFMLHGALLVDH